MSYTNQTTNLNLPIYEAQDKPSYLGDWNEAMEALDTGYGAVKTIENNVDALETTVETINVTVEETNAVVKNLETSVNENKIATEKNTKEINKIKLSLEPKGWNVVLIGDSYLDKHGIDRANLADTFKRIYPNITWHNYADSGSGFGMGGIQGRNFAQQVTNAAADLTSKGVSVETITHVFVIGGRNDAGAQDGSNNIDRSALTQKVNECLGNVASSFPKAKAVMIPCLYDWKLPRIALLSVEAVVREASQKKGVWCARNAWSLGIGEMAKLYNGGDDIHPNENGCELMCRSIMSAIVNNNPNMMRCQFATAGNYRFYLYESGIEVRGASFNDYTGNVIIPRNELPSFIKVGASDEVNWYEDGSTLPVKYQLNTYGVLDEEAMMMTFVYFNSEGFKCAKAAGKIRMSFLIPFGF
jgi:hypothetical protein